MKTSNLIALLCVLLAVQQASSTNTIADDDFQKCKCTPAGIAPRQAIPANGNIDLSAATPALSGSLFGVNLKLYTLEFALPSTPKAVTFSAGVKTLTDKKCMAILQTGCGCKEVFMEGSYLDVGINPTGTFTQTHTYPGSGSTPEIGVVYWSKVAAWIAGSPLAPGNAHTQTWESPAPDCSKINVNLLLVGDCAPGVTEADIISDPHIVSWERVGQTVFHEGDFVLAESRATGLAVHGRLCKSSRGPWAPWTCGIAVRCDRESTPVEVSAGAWDKVAIATAATKVTDSASGVRTIACSSGLNIQMMRHRFHRFAYLNARLSLDPRTQSKLADLRGLLGSPNANHDDELVRRDGTSATAVADQHLIGHTSAALDDVHDSWRVGSSERLFSSSFVPVGGVVPASKRRHIPSAVTAAAQGACEAAGVTDDVHAAACAHDTVMLRQRKNAFAKDLVAFVQALEGAEVFPFEVTVSS